jgi:hypothetical protein
MRRTFSVAVLILAFCYPAAAGVIHNPPPPQTPLPDGEVTEAVDVKTDGDETDSHDWADSLTQITLDLLSVLPALF